MSKRKYQSKNGIIGKIALTVVLVIVLAAGALCCGFASRDAAGQWFRNWNLSTWHWSDKPTEGTANGKPTDGMTTSTASSQFMSLRSTPMTAGASSRTDSTYRLTATVEPADADYQELEWLVSFENSSSAWANGKAASDFVNVAPSSDTHNATVTCLGDFGEPVIITVKSKDNPEAYATCRCDYVKRVKSLTFTVDDPTFTSAMGYSYEIEPTAYTIDSEITLDNVKIALTYGFNSAVMQSGVISSEFAYNCVFGCDDNTPKALTVDNVNQTLSFAGDTPSEALFWFNKDYYDEETLITFTPEEIAEAKLQTNKAFRQTVRTYEGNQATLKFTYAITYNGENYGSGTASANINFNFETIKISVSSVKLDFDNIPM